MGFRDGHEPGAGLDWGSSVPGTEMGTRLEGRGLGFGAGVQGLLSLGVKWDSDRVGWMGVGAGGGERTRVGDDRAGGLQGLDTVAWALQGCGGGARGGRPDLGAESRPDLTRAASLGSGLVCAGFGAVMEPSIPLSLGSGLGWPRTCLAARPGLTCVSWASAWPPVPQSSLSSGRGR